MRKPVRRNAGKSKPVKIDPKDEMVTILQDISATLDAILKLLEDELQEEDEPEPKQQSTQPQGSG